MLCPRRQEAGVFPGGPFNVPETDSWHEDDHTCSWCGGLDPDVLFVRLEKGDVTLTPTDKNYKVYVNNAGGEQFKQTYRDCPRDEPSHGPWECSHWVTCEVSTTKLYFQHFSEDQQRLFITMINEKRLKLETPGYFYRPPFFMRYK